MSSNSQTDQLALAFARITASEALDRWKCNNIALLAHGAGNFGYNASNLQLYRGQASFDRDSDYSLRHLNSRVTTIAQGNFENQEISLHDIINRDLNVTANGRQRLHSVFDGAKEETLNKLIEPYIEPRTNQMDLSFIDEYFDDNIEGFRVRFDIPADVPISQFKFDGNNPDHMAALTGLIIKAVYRDHISEDQLNNHIYTMRTGQFEVITAPPEQDFREARGAFADGPIGAYKEQINSYEKKNGDRLYYEYLAWYDNTLPSSDDRTSLRTDERITGDSGDFIHANHRYTNDVLSRAEEYAKLFGWVDIVEEIGGLDIDEDISQYASHGQSWTPEREAAIREFLRYARTQEVQSAFIAKRSAERARELETQDAIDSVVEAYDGSYGSYEDTETENPFADRPNSLVGDPSEEGYKELVRRLEGILEANTLTVPYHHLQDDEARAKLAEYLNTNSPLTISDKHKLSRDDITFDNPDFRACVEAYLQTSNDSGHEDFRNASGGSSPQTLIGIFERLETPESKAAYQAVMAERAIIEIQRFINDNYAGHQLPIEEEIPEDGDITNPEFLKAYQLMAREIGREAANLLEPQIQIIAQEGQALYDSVPEGEEPELTIRVQLEDKQNEITNLVQTVYTLRTLSEGEAFHAVIVPESGRIEGAVFSSAIIPALQQADNNGQIQQDSTLDQFMTLFELIDPNDMENTRGTMSALNFQIEQRIALATVIGHEAVAELRDVDIENLSRPNAPSSNVMLFRYLLDNFSSQNIKGSEVISTDNFMYLGDQTTAESFSQTVSFMQQQLISQRAAFDVIHIDQSMIDNLPADTDAETRRTFELGQRLPEILDEIQRTGVTGQLDQNLIDAVGVLTAYMQIPATDQNGNILVKNQNDEFMAVHPNAHAAFLSQRPEWSTVTLYMSSNIAAPAGLPVPVHPLGDAATPEQVQAFHSQYYLSKMAEATTSFAMLYESYKVLDDDNKLALDTALEAIENGTEVPAGPTLETSLRSISTGVLSSTDMRTFVEDLENLDALLVDKGYILELSEAAVEDQIQAYLDNLDDGELKQKLTDEFKEIEDTEPHHTASGHLVDMEISRKTWALHKAHVINFDTAVLLQDSYDAAQLGTQVGYSRSDGAPEFDTEELTQLNRLFSDPQNLIDHIDLPEHLTAPETPTDDQYSGRNLDTTLAMLHGAHNTYQSLEGTLNTGESIEFADVLSAYEENPSPENLQRLQTSVLQIQADIGHLHHSEYFSSTGGYTAAVKRQLYDEIMAMPQYAATLNPENNRYDDAEKEAQYQTYKSSRTSYLYLDEPLPESISTEYLEEFEERAQVEEGANSLRYTLLEGSRYLISYDLQNHFGERYNLSQEMIDRYSARLDVLRGHHTYSIGGLLTNSFTPQGSKQTVEILHAIQTHLADNPELFTGEDGQQALEIVQRLSRAHQAYEAFSGDKAALASDLRVDINPVADGILSGVPAETMGAQNHILRMQLLLLTNKSEFLTLHREDRPLEELETELLDASTEVQEAYKNVFGLREQLEFLKEAAANGHITQRDWAPIEQAIDTYLERSDGLDLIDQVRLTGQLDQATLSALAYVSESFDAPNAAVVREQVYNNGQPVTPEVLAADVNQVSEALAAFNEKLESYTPEQQETLAAIATRIIGGEEAIVVLAEYGINAEGSTNPIEIAKNDDNTSEPNLLPTSLVVDDTPAPGTTNTDNETGADGDADTVPVSVPADGDPPLTAEQLAAQRAQEENESALSARLVQFQTAMDIDPADGTLNDQTKTDLANSIRRALEVYMRDSSEIVVNGKRFRLETNGDVFEMKTDGEDKVGNLLTIDPENTHPAAYSILTQLLETEETQLKERFRNEKIQDLVRLVEDPAERADIAARLREAKTEAAARDIMRPHQTTENIADVSTLIAVIWNNDYSEIAQGITHEDYRAYHGLAAAHDIIGYYSTGNMSNRLDTLRGVSSSISTEALGYDDRLFISQVYYDLYEHGSVSGDLVGPEYVGQTLTRAQLSEIALERLVDAAADLGIAEGNITNAMMSGEFVPYWEDFKLAYEGTVPDGSLDVLPALRQELEAINQLEGKAYEDALNNLDDRIRNHGAYPDTDGYLSGHLIVWYKQNGITGREDILPSQVMLQGEYARPRDDAWNERFGSVTDRDAGSRYLQRVRGHRFREDFGTPPVRGASFEEMRDATSNPAGYTSQVDSVLGNVSAFAVFEMGSGKENYEQMRVAYIEKLKEDQAPASRTAENRSNLGENLADISGQPSEETPGPDSEVTANPEAQPTEPVSSATTP